MKSLRCIAILCTMALYTVGCSSIKIISTLCGDGSLNKQDRQLLLAVSDNDLEMVRRSLANGANPNAVDSDTGLLIPVLCQAAFGDQAEVVNALLNAGADVDKADAWGQTSLMRAARQGHTKVIELLIDAGASCKRRDAFGKSVLEHAKDDAIHKLLRQACLLRAEL